MPYLDPWLQGRHRLPWLRRTKRAVRIIGWLVIILVYISIIWAVVANASQTNARHHHFHPGCDSHSRQWGVSEGPGKIGSYRETVSRCWGSKGHLTSVHLSVHISRTSLAVATGYALKHDDTAVTTRNLHDLYYYQTFNHARVCPKIPLIGLCILPGFTEKFQAGPEVYSPHQQHLLRPGWPAVIWTPPFEAPAGQRGYGLKFKHEAVG